LEGADCRGRDGQRLAAAARTGFTEYTAVTECRPRKRVGSPAGDARVQARAMPERLDAPHTERHRHPGRRTRAVQRPEPAHQQAEEGHVPIALGSQPRHALDHPRGLRQLLEVLAHAIEGPRDVEVVDADQLAAPAIEEDELAERAELERAAEP